jgi:hypothetical protein
METAKSLGQLGGGQSLEFAASFEPRGRVNAKPECNLSENTTSCQNGIVPQRTKANEAVRIVFPNSHWLRTERPPRLSDNDQRVVALLR